MQVALAVSAASLRRATMALPVSSTGTASTRMLPFEPGANGITVFSLRSIITQLLFNYSHVDDRQSNIFCKCRPRRLMKHTGLSTKDGIVDNRIYAESCKKFEMIIF